MNIVVDEIITVLQVLAFADAIRGNQNIYFFIDMRIDGSLIFGDGREQCEQFVKVQFLPFG